MADKTIKTRASQVPAVQGANEQRKEDVRVGTSTAQRSSQRRNAGASAGRTSSLAAQADRTVRNSGKKAVILTGGKQYLVEEGRDYEIELLEPGKNASFDALLVIDGDKTTVGAPLVDGVKVAADIVEQVVKADKVIAIRYKAKKRVHKTRGHRQKLTRIKITKIA
jgi:large subunit ribosomal protein L21